MNSTFTRDDLLKLRDLINSQLEALGEPEGEKPTHKVGDKTILHHSGFGDMEMDCVHVYDGGKRGLYLMHYGLPNMEFDAAESTGRGQDYGNNDYDDANCRQWMNSKEDDWFHRRHVFDAPPSYADRPGLLAGFDGETLARIAPKDGDLFFLLSYEEVNGELPYLQTEEGKELLKKTDKDGNAVWWWLRSPYPDDPSDVRGVDRGGSTYTGHNAFRRGSALAPACVIE